MNLPKTIQIFLPDGSARSIRIAEITSRTVQAVLIPRIKLKDAEKRSEIKNVGIYFLFGESDDGVKPLVYIGETEDCYQRLKQHNQNKDFWNIAVVITSRTNSFTKAHAKYLEWYSHALAKEIDRFKIESTSSATKPFVSEQMEADLLDNFDTIKILLSTLGYPIFEELSKSRDKKEVLFCKGKDAFAEGEYIDDGFVVFKGSKANPIETKSAGAWLYGLSKKLVENDILKHDKNILVFTADYIFSSPSAAAASILARRANGWIEWKNKDGKTLDELKRQ
jgi:predicted GIY-YIG superfamily endonuclease